MEAGSRPFSTARRSSSAPPAGDLLSRYAQRQPPVAPRGDPLEGVGGHAAQDYRGMRLCSRLGEAVHRREAVVPALVRALLLCPELLHRLHGLPPLGPAAVEVDAEQLPLLPQTAHSDSKQKSPARVHVQRGHLFGKSDGVAGGNDHDRGAELQRGSRGRGAGQGYERVDDVSPEPWDRVLHRNRQRVLLRHPDRVEPQLLRPPGKDGDVRGAHRWYGGYT